MGMFKSIGKFFAPKKRCKAGKKPSLTSWCEIKKTKKKR
jgi:hypothetical protein